MRYNRTQASRTVYAACSFVILVGWPLWLKLMTIDMISTHKNHRPYRPFGSIEFVGDALGNTNNCETCMGYKTSVSWPIQVKVHNTSGQAEGGQYVITYTAEFWKGPWYQSSLPSILNTVNNMSQVLDVCKVPKQLSMAPTSAPTAMYGRRELLEAGAEAEAEKPAWETAAATSSSSQPPPGLPASVLSFFGHEEEGLELPPYVDPTSASDLRAWAEERRVAEARAAEEDAVVAQARAARQAAAAGAGAGGRSPMRDGAADLWRRFAPERLAAYVLKGRGGGAEEEGAAWDEEDRRALLSTKISGMDDAVSLEDKELIECCHGAPGPVYVVACIVQDFADVRKTKGKHQHGPPFDDRCVQVSGVCGGSCGTQVREPDYCVDGKIPEYLLVSDKCKGPYDDDCGPGTEDDFEQMFSIPPGDVFDLFGLRLYFTQTPVVWHWFFMVMMFMSYVSICVASIPGAGVCGSAHERLPILHTLDQNGAIKDGVKCISFSISASEHKIWVVRNVIGKIAASFLHPSARLYDYFQDEGCRAGAFALWDAIVHFMHVPPGVKEDTVGLCKFWAARLRDPGESLSKGLDTFKKDSEAPASSMAEIERTFDAFEDIHQVASKFNVPEERLSMLHYAYELYELIECLGDRQVWTGWDVTVGSKEEKKLKVNFDAAANQADANAAAGEKALPETVHGFRRASMAPNRNSSFLTRASMAGGRDSTATGQGLRAAAFAEAAAAREAAAEEAAAAAGRATEVRHLDGFRDWLHHPVMSSFVLQWAHSLCDVAYAAKRQTKSLDPFSDEVLGFARKDEVALRCAQQLNLFSAETKIGDKANAGKGSGRFMEAYSNFKATTGQLLYDYIDEREVTMGTYRGVFTWVPATLIYGTRAKPERRDKDAIKKRNLQPGVYACLNGDIELPSYPAGLTKWEAQRRCYGKVREILADRNVDGRRVKFVELSHLSEDMAANKVYLESLYTEAQEIRSLWTPALQPSAQQQKAARELAATEAAAQAGASTNLNPDLMGGNAMGNGGPGALSLSSSAFIQLPMSVVAPLLRCRGKAGGMNFAVKVLEEREYERAAADPTHHVPSLTLFAIFDCRHMVTPGFWEQTILHFFREREGEVHLQPSVKYCQVPQNFIGVELATDYLDMQNEFLFRYVNCQRDGVGAVTSCGTNCVWAIERGFEYEEKTMIEDTATSHKVILQGYEGTYHYEKLIFGTPKENKDFLAAIFRWSRGAVQLFWLAVFGGRTEGSAGVPFLWLVLFLVVLPMAITVFGMLSATDHGADSFYLAAAIYSIFFVCCSAVWCLVMNRKFGHLLRYIVLFDNSTYFFNTFPAYFWCLVLPGYMCNAGDIPFKYSLMIVAFGGLLWESLQWILVLEVKGWSIIEGKRPKDISILRSQQMYFVNCPLHGVAFYSGTKSAYRIITAYHDASSWSSFGHGGPGDWIQKWLLFLVTFEVTCISSAIIQIGTGGISDGGRVTSFGVGITTAMIFLGLVFDPFCILLSGKTRTVTLKHAYFVFWTVMLVLGIIVLGSGFMINTKGAMTSSK